MERGSNAQPVVLYPLLAYIASGEHDQLCLKYLVKYRLWDFPVLVRDSYYLFVSTEKQQLLQGWCGTENVHQLPSGPIEVIYAREEGILREVLTDCMGKTSLNTEGI